MKSKMLVICSYLIVITLLLTACGTATTTAPTSAPVVQTTVAPVQATEVVASTCPLKVEDGATIVFSGWGDETEQQVYKDSIERFKTVCPTVTVDYQPIPDKFQDKLKAQMAGGTAPDVFYVDDQLMTAFASSGQLMALDDVMTEAGVSRDDFIPTLLTIFTLDGKTFALPKDWSTLGLVYLPEAFTDAGIAEPTDTWTWDDMRTAAKAIAAKGTYAGFCMGADWARFAPFVFSNDGDYANSDFSAGTLDTTEVKTMATYVTDMFNEKSLVRPADISASWCGEAIGKKLVAMTLEGGWMVNSMKLDYSDVVWKTTLVPSGSKTRADVIFTNGIGVNVSTKYPMAAAAFAIFLTGRDNQGEIVKTGFAYSTHPDQIDLIGNVNDKAIADGGLLSDTKVAYWGPYTSKLEDSVSKALERVWLGDQTVDEAFAQAQAEATTALSGQ